MNYQFIIDQLEENAGAFKALLKISQEQAQWKPSSAKWSILEVVNHLCDEEREDFRYRLRAVLNKSRDPWPPIAPEDWVLERGYSKRAFEPSVLNFLQERADSIEWLRGLSSPQWQASYTHPELGPISAEMILANWLAHDYLHFRQILSLKYGYLSTLADPLSLDYAGRW